MKSYTNDDKVREQCLARILYEGDMSSARKEGQNRIIKLFQLLNRDNRTGDATQCITDPDLLEKLLKEYEL